MAQITSTGVEADGLTGFTQRFQQIFRDALGQDLDLSVESPQGQIISGSSLMLAQEEQALIGVSNGFDIDRAIGQQLDDLCSLLLIERSIAKYSTVTVTLTGTAAAVVPKGKRARTTAGAIFALTSEATIGSGGTVDATMQATESGPVAAAAGTLTSIVDLVAGWTAVTNAAAATLGRVTEPDVSLRARHDRHVHRNARGSLSAIESTVLEVDGVTDVLARDNTTNSDETVQTVTIDARSFLVIAEGGTDDDVAAAIERTKPPGTPMTGAVTVNVPHPSGDHSTPIKFSRVTAVPLAVTITTTIGLGFPGDGSNEIIRRVAAWAAGTWTAGEGLFDTTGIKIGESLDQRRLLSPIQSVPGHTVTSVDVTVKSGGGAVGTPALNERFTIAEADVTIA